MTSLSLILKSVEIYTLPFWLDYLAFGTPKAEGLSGMLQEPVIHKLLGPATLAMSKI